MSQRVSESNHSASDSKSLEFETYMSESDTLLWVGERDPRLRSTIVTVWLLDQMPDLEEMQSMLMDAAAAVPRLRQRVVRDPLEIAPPRWELDPNFDPAFHFRKLHLGGTGELRDLFDVAEPIAMQAFDKDRPLWEYYVVDGLSEGRAGVIMKLHHAVSDGVGLVKMTKSLVAVDRDGTGAGNAVRSLPVAPRASTKQELTRDALQHRVEFGRKTTERLLSGGASFLGKLLNKPQEALEGVREMAGSIGRLLEPIIEPKSPLMRDRGMSLALDGFTIPVEELKQVGRELTGSLNDVFVTAVSGGLRRYHEHFGKPADELNMMMPINLRTTDDGGLKAGNQFAPSRMLIPVSIEDPQELLRAVQERVREQRNEPALAYLEDIMGVMNGLPNAALDSLMEGMTTAVDFVTSNVPGPRRAIYTAGAKILQQYPFGPPAGAAVNITLFSYNGICHIGINADRSAVSDPALLSECIQKSFAALLPTEA